MTGIERYTAGDFLIFRGIESRWNPLEIEIELEEGGRDVSNISRGKSVLRGTLLRDEAAIRKRVKSSSNPPQLKEGYVFTYRFRSKDSSKIQDDQECHNCSLRQRWSGKIFSFSSVGFVSFFNSSSSSHSTPTQLILYLTRPE